MIRINTLYLHIRDQALYGTRDAIHVSGSRILEEFHCILKGVDDARIHGGICNKIIINKYLKKDIIMKQLPKVNASFENLYEMLLGPIRSKLLLTGIEMKVFNHLSEPKSVDAVVEAIGSHPQNTRLFLDGLAACDLVTKKDGMYRNTAIAQEFLVEGSQMFMGPMLSMMPLALTGQDMRFDQGEIADSMLRVGFESVRSRTLDTDWGPMDLDIGRRE
jgi:hypothetical protein